MAEQRAGAGVHAGRDDAAGERAVAVDHFHISGGAEIDHHHGRAVQHARCHAVGDAVGADLARVGIVAGIEQPGGVLGGAHHRAHADHLLGCLTPRLGERRDHRRQRHAADIVERDALGAEQRDELHAQLVARVQLVGGHAPAEAQLLVLIHAQNGLGVSHVYCQQHGAAPLVLMSPVAAFRDGADFSAHQYSSRPQDGRQAHGKRPNPPAECTHRAIRAGFERRRTGAGRGGAGPGAGRCGAVRALAQGGTGRTWRSSGRTPVRSLTDNATSPKCPAGHDARVAAGRRGAGRRHGLRLGDRTDKPPSPSVRTDNAPSPSVRIGSFRPGEVTCF